MIVEDAVEIVPSMCLPLPDPVHRQPTCGRQFLDGAERPDEMVGGRSIAV